MWGVERAKDRVGELAPSVGFDGTYVARAGDLGSDGDTDIYLSPLAVGTGHVGEFILRNDAGEFVLHTSPTVAELAAAQTWLVSTQLIVILEDVNVDGVWDAHVGGVSGTAGFAGAVDPIVIAPASAGGFRRTACRRKHGYSLEHYHAGPEVCASSRCCQWQPKTAHF